MSPAAQTGTTAPRAGGRRRRGVGGEDPVYITPDIYVYKVGEDFHVLLNEDGLPKLKINSCSPGMIATDLIGSFLPWWAPVPNALMRWLATKMMNAKTPDEGTVATMHLLFAELEGNGRLVPTPSNTCAPC